METIQSQTPAVALDVCKQKTAVPLGADKAMLLTDDQVAMLYGPYPLMVSKADDEGNAGSRCAKDVVSHKVYKTSPLIVETFLDARSAGVKQEKLVRFVESDIGSVVTIEVANSIMTIAVDQPGAKFETMSIKLADENIYEVEHKFDGELSLMTNGVKAMVRAPILGTGRQVPRTVRQYLGATSPARYAGPADIAPMEALEQWAFYLKAEVVAKETLAVKTVAVDSLTEAEIAMIVAARQAKA
jgi:hypothetical protein